ncbi:hypothetical protein PFY12_03530 [Chryseobacterium camelliae]|uniref:Uncharacterized protein n=1 Tax=Chryseobacterium camelliae TaxID=1265445 RepID=A0ABY7QQF3_9FLAO|nr:hypothetical protein [Chryseobacterium camelliae]WBV61197.1 hypothetical protein PFY12_03530 [Chryseobacterium camelliae]
MMKNLLIGTFTLISCSAFSQEYKQKFSREVCECVKNIDATNKTKKELSTQFGLCAFKHATSYKNELKRDFGIDLVADIKDEKKMENFGVQVGMMMVGECPDVFSKVMGDGESDSEAESSQLLITGTISKIEKDNFVVFHVVGDNKILTKLYWVSTIESNLDLPKEYSSLVNKKVNISYYTTEIFDAKINDYRNLNIISSLKTD